MKHRKNLSLNNCYLLESPVFQDDRGNFREWYWGYEFPHQPAQGNVSCSHAGVIRGLHLSISQRGQAKWITCFSGEINDVIVDLRPGSSTYLQHEVINLNSNSGRILSIPSGVAHGFLSLKDDSIVGYLVSSKFNAVDEVGINPLDSELGINWEASNPIISEKDRSAPGLFEFLEKHSSSLRAFS